MSFKDYIEENLKDLCIEIGVLNRQKYIGPNTPHLITLIDMMQCEAPPGAIASLAVVDATLHIGNAAMAVIARS